MIDPTPEQRDVIESKDPNLVVSAAAGSGKTRVLVSRYLRFVEEGYTPDQILTITYTRKAAAEMKRRIVQELSARGNKEAAQIAETGPIQTIHGFCERTLRENAIAAKLDPRFEIIEQGDDKALISRAVTSALAIPFVDDGEDNMAAELIQALAGRRSANSGTEPESPHAVLIHSVSRLIEKFRGTRISVEELLRLGSSPELVRTLWLEKLMAALPGAVREVLDPEGALEERLTKAYKEAKTAKPKWVRPFDDEEETAARHTCALLQLAASAWRSIETEMARRGKLDFILLERLAVELVSSHKGVQDRLAEQYPVIFVDEAQDLNPMQYELLRALQPRHRMMVGDSQQSIYGFRLADVELFRKHPKDSGLTPLPLTKNFRSSSGILAFVDELFKRVWPDAYKSMGEEGKVVYLESAPKPPFEGVELWPLEFKDTAATARMIRDMVSEQVRAKDVCVLVRRSAYGVELLRRLERLEVKARIVGGTESYFTRMEVRDVANVLRALVNAHDDFSLAATLRSPFAGISLDTLVILRKRALKEKLSLYNVITNAVQGPLPEPDGMILKTFLAWFDRMRRYADRLAAWEAIGELYAVTPYLENLAKRPNYAQLLANARKLLSLASARPERGPAEFAEGVREIQRLGHREGEAPVDDEDEDAVTIMTVHKAKGLEFPVVVVPETHSQIGSKHRGWVVADARLPMVVTQFPGGQTIYGEFLNHKESERDAEEEWRVLYVALTRAQHKLCVVVDPRKRGDTYASLIAKHIGFSIDAPPAGVRVREV